MTDRHIPAYSLMDKPGIFEARQEIHVPVIPRGPTVFVTSLRKSCPFPLDEHTIPGYKDERHCESDDNPHNLDVLAPPLVKGGKFSLIDALKILHRPRDVIAGGARSGRLRSSKVNGGIPASHTYKSVTKLGTSHLGPAFWQYR